MNNLDNILNNYYKIDYTEDDRLTKDKTHLIEYITTTKYIEKYLNKDSKILEIGAGTGIYSINYAKKGYNVTAIELIEDNLKILNSKIVSNMNIKTYQGNAINLSMLEDNTYDVTLLLGPLYHLFKKEDRIKAIEEAKRVTKPNGVILIAFVLFDISMLDWGYKRGNIYNNYGENKMVNLDYTPNNKEEYIFNMDTIYSIKDLLSNINNIKIINYIATDGVGRLIKDTINNMTDEEYKNYINYHLSICERQDLIGYSGHILSIIRKER